jgi:lipoate-protein ligase B
VWAPGGKVGSIGIGVRRGVAFHGTSLNVDVDPEFFSSIVVCRAPTTRVTSIRAEVGTAPALETVASVYADAFLAVMGYSAAQAEFFHRDADPSRRNDRRAAETKGSARN